ncbi:MAG: AraC family transcriptional regulator, partial [Verrucomicrobiota bacterium]
SITALATQNPFYHQFDHLPGISFFAKNRNFEIVCANQLFLQRFGFKTEAEIVGKTDFELFPPALALNFRRDDEFVIQSAEPKLNIVELFFNQQGIPDWYLTNKLPVHDSSGKVIGLMGTVQSYERRKQFMLPYFQIDKAVNHIREHYREKISVKELAAMVNLSVRQFDRKFKESFGSGPQAFILKMRIQAACDALRRPGAQISDVAVDLGFYDQSSFTLHFRRHMGITPLKYQRQLRQSAPYAPPPNS